MVPGDIGAELAKALQAAASAGELPRPAGRLSAAGTWRPAPPGEGGGPGTYATSLPMLLARPAGPDARQIAARLAGALETVPWITAARVSGPGYLTVTVTTRHLAGLPARIMAAGAPTLPDLPALPDPATAPDWGPAWNAHRDALVTRLAMAAGGPDSLTDPERLYRGDRALPPGSPSGAGGPEAGGGVLAAGGGVLVAGGGVLAAGRGGPVAGAVAWHGVDAVRYAMTRTARPRPAAIERQLGLPLDLDNPFVLVRYAHGHAASVARWAADLIRASGAGAGEPPAGRPHGQPSDPEPAELALTGALSWSAERLAAAARRRRPAELCAYLEHVAGAYQRCALECPALPFGGAGAPPKPTGLWPAARRELAGAARAVLATGLSLAGVSSPVELFDI